VAESDRLLSDCTPVKGVPRVQIPLSPPFLKNCAVSVDTQVARPHNIYDAPMAQLDRAPDYESGCRKFESCWAHQKIKGLP
jgi:hypothetical protein